MLDEKDVAISSSSLAPPSSPHGMRTCGTKKDHEATLQMSWGLHDLRKHYEWCKATEPMSHLVQFQLDTALARFDRTCTSLVAITPVDDGPKLRLWPKDPIWDQRFYNNLKFYVEMNRKLPNSIVIMCCLFALQGLPWIFDHADNSTDKSEERQDTGKSQPSSSTVDHVIYDSTSSDARFGIYFARVLDDLVQEADQLARHAFEHYNCLGHFNHFNRNEVCYHTIYLKLMSWAEMVWKILNLLGILNRAKTIQYAALFYRRHDIDIIHQHLAKLMQLCHLTRDGLGSSHVLCRVDDFFRSLTSLSVLSTTSSMDTKEVPWGSVMNRMNFVRKHWKNVMFYDWSSRQYYYPLDSGHNRRLARDKSFVQERNQILIHMMHHLPSDVPFGHLRGYVTPSIDSTHWFNRIFVPFHAKREFQQLPVCAFTFKTTTKTGDQMKPFAILRQSHKTKIKTNPEHIWSCFLTWQDFVGANKQTDHNYEHLYVRSLTLDRGIWKQIYNLWMHYAARLMSWPIQRIHVSFLWVGLFHLQRCCMQDATGIENESVQRYKKEIAPLMHRLIFYEKIQSVFAKFIHWLFMNSKCMTVTQFILFLDILLQTYSIDIQNLVSYDQKKEDAEDFDMKIYRWFVHDPNPNKASGVMRPVVVGPVVVGPMVNVEKATSAEYWTRFLLPEQIQDIVNACQCLFWYFPQIPKPSGASMPLNANDLLLYVNETEYQRLLLIHPHDKEWKTSERVRYCNLRAGLCRIYQFYQILQSHTATVAKTKPKTLFPHLYLPTNETQFYPLSPPNDWKFQYELVALYGTRCLPATNISFSRAIRSESLHRSVKGLVTMPVSLSGPQREPLLSSFSRSTPRYQAHSRLMNFVMEQLGSKKTA